MNPNVHQLIRLCAQLLAQAPTHVVDNVQDAAEATHSVWREHQRLMNTNGVYQAVVTSLAGLLGRQLDLERVILTVISALIRHATRPTRPRFGDDRDYYPDDEFDGWPG